MSEPILPLADLMSDYEPDISPEAEKGEKPRTQHRKLGYAFENPTGVPKLKNGKIDWKNYPCPDSDVLHGEQMSLQLWDMRCAYELTWHKDERPQITEQRKYLEEHRKDFMTLMSKLEKEYQDKVKEILKKEEEARQRKETKVQHDLGSQKVLDLGRRLLREFRDRHKEKA